MSLIAFQLFKLYICIFSTEFLLETILQIESTQTDQERHQVGAQTGRPRRQSVSDCLSVCTLIFAVAVVVVAVVIFELVVERWEMRSEERLRDGCARIAL